jgi:hypothetical protein
MKNVKLKMALLPLVIAMPIFNASADDNVSKAQLEKQLKVISQRLAALEIPEKAASSKTNFNVYGTLRPTFGVASSDSDDSWDVGDALSRVGFSAEHKLDNGMIAFAKGEFKVNIQANGDFGEARKAYVGIKGDFGRFTIGKQASPQYSLIADPVDIFNRASTPLAYDAVSPFRTNNLVSYNKSFGDVSLSVASQFNKDDTDDSGSDFSNAGLSYNTDVIRASIAYYERDEEETLGVSFAKNFGDLYLATSYQDRDVSGISSSTFDVVASYAINKTYKVKFGLSDFDDDDNGMNSGSYSAFNSTLEWHGSKDFYTFIEYQNNSFDEREDTDQLMVGMRYNFDYKF